MQEWGNGSSPWQRLGQGVWAPVTSCSAGRGDRSRDMEGCAGAMGCDMEGWFSLALLPYRALLCSVSSGFAQPPSPHTVWHHSGLARALCSFTHVTSKRVKKQPDATPVNRVNNSWFG